MSDCLGSVRSSAGRGNILVKSPRMYSCIRCRCRVGVECEIDLNLVDAHWPWEIEPRDQITAPSSAGAIGSSRS